VVERIDGTTPGDLREIALAVRQHADVRVVVLGGVTDTGGVALVAALATGTDGQAADVIRDAAKAVGGGGGGKGDVAAAGGKNPAALDDALALARTAAINLVGAPR
jgi:alanyl-tRNA synthetase